MNKDNKVTISRHPQYDEYSDIWAQMRDTAAGELAVKMGDTKYLPKTPGQKEDRNYGTQRYMCYKTRAIFYDYVADTIKDSLGLLHKEPTLFNTDNERLLAYKESPTKEIEDFQTFLRRIHENQLICGRCGLLLDIDDEGNPKTVVYPAERIVNWDTTPNPTWIVLDESDYEINVESMSYEWVNKYRLLAIDANGFYFTTTFKEWSSELLSPDENTIYPMVIGKKFNKIPFTFVNASSIISDVEQPPLLPISNSCLAIYRSEADRQQALFLQCQATLFMQGFQEEDLADMQFGAGAFISSSNPDAKAEFLEIAGNGLSEMRENIDGLKDYASSLGIELSEKSAVESGAALNTRFTIRTASLQTIAKTCSAAVSQQIGFIIEWYGLGSVDYTIDANMDFVKDEQNAQELLNMWSLVGQKGFTIKDYHAWLMEKDYTQLPLMEWMKELNINNV